MHNTSFKEEIIKNAFVEAFNSIIENRDKILLDYEIIISQITDTKFQKKEIIKIEEESAKVEILVEKLVAENARSAISQEEYNSRYETYVTKYNGLQQRKQDLNTEIVLAKARHNQINAFINQLKKQEYLLTEFDEGLWSGTLNYVVVISEQKLVFYFKEGTEAILILMGIQIEVFCSMTLFTKRSENIFAIIIYSDDVRDAFLINVYGISILDFHSLTKHKY